MIDVHSDTWRTIVKHAEQRIESYRGALEVSGLPYDETEAVRARIDELRQLIRLPRPEKIPKQDPSEEPR